MIVQIATSYPGGFAAIWAGVLAFVLGTLAVLALVIGLIARFAMPARLGSVRRVIVFTFACAAFGLLAGVIEIVFVAIDASQSKYNSPFTADTVRYFSMRTAVALLVIAAAFFLWKTTVSKTNKGNAT